jgi:hypothetical protein
MSKEKESKMSLRKCANIKSRSSPDQRCAEEATYGEFCAKHIKRPTRFPLVKGFDIQLSRKQEETLKKIQRKYKFKNGLRRNRNQGPSTSFTELSENETEIYSLESVKSIPILYRFSFSDLQNHIFTFDIRTLYQLVQESGYKLSNPYNRDLISKEIIDKLIRRINFLRSKKYCLLVTSDNELTQDQLIHQRVIDICLKYDFLGFYTSPEWFENLDIRGLKDVYISLYGMFVSNPIADAATLDGIYSGRRDDLFELRINGINNRKDKKILQNALLNAFEKIITTSSKKENKSLGATYCLKCWAGSYPQIYINYPWLV